MRLARSSSEESLRLFGELGDKWGIATSLAGLAGAAGARREYECAVQLLGAASAAREAIEGVQVPRKREFMEEVSKAAREALSAELHERAWAEGRAMSTEEAVAFVLQETQSVSPGLDPGSSS